MKRSTIRTLIGYISRAIYNGYPDPAPLTIAPVVKVESSQPVSLSALRAQSETAQRAMEGKRERAMAFLAAHPLPHRRHSFRGPSPR